MLLIFPIRKLRLYSVLCRLRGKTYVTLLIAIFLFLILPTVSFRQEQYSQELAHN